MRTAMILGHPGHELRAYRWMELNKPVVYVLTDGSGSLSEGRIGSTEQVVAGAGASCGAYFGQFKDAAFYDGLLHGRVDGLLNAMVQIYGAIRSEFREEELTIVGDGVEGYNTAHDITRYMINILCERLRADGYRVHNYAYNLVDDPSVASQHVGAEDLVLELDDAAFGRKLGAARNYPELAEEVERAIAEVGEGGFRFEVFSKVPDAAPLIFAPGESIFYEEYGRKRVAEGKYSTVILFEEHIRPYAEELRARFAEYQAGGKA